MGRRASSPKPMWKRSKKRVHQLWPLPPCLRFPSTNLPLHVTLCWQDYNSQPPAAPLNTFGTSNPVDDWNRCSVDVFRICARTAQSKPSAIPGLEWQGGWHLLNSKQMTGVLVLMWVPVIGKNFHKMFDRVWTELLSVCDHHVFGIHFGMKPL